MLDTKLARALKQKEDINKIYLKLFISLLAISLYIFRQRYSDEEENCEKPLRTIPLLTEEDTL